MITLAYYMTGPKILLNTLIDHAVCFWRKDVSPSFVVLMVIFRGSWSVKCARTINNNKTVIGFLS